MTERVSPSTKTGRRSITTGTGLGQRKRVGFARWAGVGGLSLAIFATLGGCPLNPTGNSNTTDKGPAKLVRFDSPDALVSYFRAQAAARTTGILYRSAGGDLGALAPTAAADANTTAESGGAPDADYTTTNVQEAGVDESDTFKSDGVNFYIAKGPSLRVVRAAPQDQMAEIGRLDLETYVNAIYLYGGKLLLLSQKFETVDPNVRFEILIWPPYYQQSTTLVYEVDISDPAKPVVSKKLEIDGALVTSRLVNDRLLLVTTIAPKLPDNPTPLALARMSLKDVLPVARSSSGESVAVAWSDLWRPVNPNGYYMTAVATLDATNIERIVSSTAVMANAGTIYASPEALYLTDTDYDMSDNYRETTAIHKFALNDDGTTSYAASGAVKGRPLNQFSLGEANGHLRVATHIQPEFVFTPVAGVDTAPAQTIAAEVDPTQPSSSVYVLGQKEDQLELTGSIENIAPGERIYSARFLGDRGYLVTFRQIDPLFVIDLKDPAAPKIAGELKIPGYSDYLHPVGENRLIGVGRSVARSPWGGIVPDKLQLSLFDVSNLADPKLIQQIAVGGPGSTSDVSYEHKAFTYLASRNLLAIPATLWRTDVDPTTSSYWYAPEFDGVLCYSVDVDAGFTEVGRLANVYDKDNTYYYAAWRRAAIIDETLYAVNSDGVRAAPLADFNAATAVTLAPNPNEYNYSYGPFEGDVSVSSAAVPDIAR